MLPVDHGPEATQHLKAFIGDHYAYSNEYVFKALWDNYNKCQFVENDGKYNQLSSLENAGSDIHEPFY